MTVTYTNGLIFDATALAADLESLIINNKSTAGFKRDGFAVTYKWTGDLVGTLALFGCDDANALGEDAGWSSVTATFPAVTTGGGNANLEVTTKHAYLRVDFTRTSGTGDLVMALTT